MIAHSPVETFDQPQTPQPVFDEHLKRYVPLPPRTVEPLTMYVTIAGMMGRCGQGVVMKDRGGK